MPRPTAIASSAQVDASSGTDRVGDRMTPGSDHEPRDAERARRFAMRVEPHLPALRGFALRRDRNLADDVVSKISEVAWRRLDDIPTGKERAWLFGVARNVLMAEQRARATRDSREVGGNALEAARAPAVDDDTAPLAEALGRLRERDRELLLLTAWEGLRTAEVADALGIRPTAARMGLVRARRRLAAALDELDPGWRSSHFELGTDGHGVDPSDDPDGGESS